MASKREVPGLADVIALVISPVLIMAMVGALVFFLIEVLYGGDYSGRVRWTVFFFVFGSVLVARIAIEMGDAKATLYAIGLGGAAFVAMLRYVEYPPGWMQEFGWLVNIALLALVWWCARQLTWDCTYIDETKDASDRSLLEAAGIENLDRPTEWREEEPPAAEEPAATEPGPIGWAQNYLRWRQARKNKAHTPGVWVVYFALAALPIFGLGQSLIPVDDGEGRRFTFWMMVVYVGSALGLLMTTAFLGLRRYLKQRKIDIPAPMAGIWLGLGAALIGGFLVVAAILPRPASETPLVDISGIVGSKERDASQWGQGSEAGKGDGAGGDQASQDAKSNSSVQGKSREAGKGQGQDDASRGSGDNKGKGGDTGKSDQSGGKQGGDQKQGDRNQQNQQQQPKNDGNQSNQQSQQQQSQRGSGDRAKQNASSRNTRTRSTPRSSVKGPLSVSSLGKVGEIIKWIVFGLLALVVVYFVLRHGLKFLANFTTWARQLLDFLNNFWARLFGGQVIERESDVVEDFANVQAPPRPFAEFANPFESGEARRLAPGELVKYSFAALEAWAWEHEQARDPQETPLEFARRLSEQYQALETDAPRLATLYARLAYARGALPETCRAQVQEFWHQLELAQDEALEGRKAGVEA